MSPYSAQMQSRGRKRAWNLRLGGIRRNAYTRSRRLISRRSQVQSPPPLLTKALETGPLLMRPVTRSHVLQAFRQKWPSTRRSRWSVRLLVTGGSGVLGRATIPLLRAQAHEIDAPAPTQLDLFNAVAVARAVDSAGAILHLATRIPPRERAGEREAWRENDRLRAEASRLLVDAALAAETEAYLQPSITFLYPTEGVVDEETPLGDVPGICARRSRPRRRPLGSRPRAGAGSFCASASSTVPAQATRCRTCATAPPCMLQTQGERSLRRSPFRAASTTSAATATTSRTSASNGSAVGDQSGRRT
jgi:NAD dependent epimerase/dehydratase family